MRKYTERDGAHADYLPLEGFANFVLEGKGPMPPGSTRVWVTCHSVWTKLVQQMASASDNGWKIELKLADRLSEVVIEYRNNDDKVVLMTGFGPASLQVLENHAHACVGSGRWWGVRTHTCLRPLSAMAGRAEEVSFLGGQAVETLQE